MINFINFTDGLDGLVAGCMLVLFAVAALTGMPALWPLVGALFGFLLWNWSPARVASCYVAATAVLAIALLVGGWLWVLGLAGAVLIIGRWRLWWLPAANAPSAARGQYRCIIKRLPGSGSLR